MRDFLKRYGTFLELQAKPKPLRRGPPEELHLELTYACNQKCPMCNLRYLDREGKELSLEEIRAFVEGSRLLDGLNGVVLSGGEALLRKDFFDILEYFRKTRPSANIHVLSNFIDRDLLLSTLRRARRPSGFGRLSIGTSIDGIGPAHDAMRGLKGSFERTSDSLKAVSREFPELSVSITFTLTPDNFDQMLPVHEWARENGYRVSFQVVVQKKETRRLVWEDRHFAVVEDHIDRIIGDICASNGAASDADLMKNPGLLSLALSLHYIGRYIRSPGRFYPQCPCGERYAMLDPYGNLYFCPVLKDRTAGNVRTQGFDAAWDSARARDVRKVLEERKCHCWLTCTNGAMLQDAMGG